MNPEDPRFQKKRIKIDHILVWILTIGLTIAAVWYLLQLLPESDDQEVEELLQETVVIEIETEKPMEQAFIMPPTEAPPGVPMPEVSEQLLSINEFSRPGDKTDKIKYIVIHYLANPGTTAQQNHDYFESLKDLKDVSMSANFVVGVEGEIIECVPPGEIAYASNEANHESISIENCHLDDTGIFTEATYQSLVHLTAFLVQEYNLDRDSIIRHYDVTGKECPLYYVEHPDKWEQFKDDVMSYLEECQAGTAKE